MKTEGKINKGKFLRQVIILLWGLFMIALGIAISTKTNLGTAPVSTLPYVLSNILPLTLGNLTIILHCLFILLQILVLRKDFQLPQLAQLILAFIFGYFVDFASFLLQGLSFPNYPLRLVGAVLSAAVIGFGVFLEVNSNLITLATEGFAKAAASKTKLVFGTWKVIVDVSLVVSAVVVSLLYFHKLIGAREGTIIGAVLVGNFAKIYMKKGFWVQRFIG